MADPLPVPPSQTHATLKFLHHDARAYLLTELMFDFPDNVSLLEGYFCPSASSSSSINDYDVIPLEDRCLSACIFAGEPCGTLDPTSRYYSDCLVISYSCPSQYTDSPFFSLIPQIYCPYDTSSTVFFDEGIVDLSLFANSSLLTLQDASARLLPTILPGRTLWGRIDFPDLSTGLFLKTVAVQGQFTAFFSRSAPFPNPDIYDEAVLFATADSRVFCPHLPSSDSFDFDFAAPTGHLFVAFISTSGSFPTDLLIDIDYISPLLPPPVVSPSQTVACIDSLSPCALLDGVSYFGEFSEPQYFSFLLEETLTSCTSVTVLLETDNNQYPYADQSLILLLDFNGVSIEDFPLITLMMCPQETFSLTVRLVYIQTYSRLWSLTVSTSPITRYLPIQHIPPLPASTKLLQNTVLIPGAADCFFNAPPSSCNYVIVPAVDPPIPWPPPLSDLTYMESWELIGPLLNSYHSRPDRLVFFFWSESTVDITNMAFVLNYEGADTQINFSRKLVCGETRRPLGLALITNQTPPFLQACEADTFFKIRDDIAEEMIRTIQPFDTRESGYPIAFLFSDILSYAEDYRACFREGSLLFFNTVPNPTPITSTICSMSDDFDPCCDPSVEMTVCCQPRVVDISLFNFTNNTKDINDTCSSGAACWESYNFDLQRQNKLLFDASFGCPSYTQDARQRLLEMIAFVSSCSRSAFSIDQFFPWACTIDDDCPPGFQCQFFQCGVPREKMEIDFVECLVGPNSTLSAYVLQRVRFLIGATSLPKTPGFVTEIFNLTQTLDCTTSYDLGIPLRQHWQFRNPFCERVDICNIIQRSNFRDTSSDEYLIRCLENNCFVPSDCIDPYSLYIHPIDGLFPSCPRFWQWTTTTFSEDQCDTQVCNDQSVDLENCSGSFCTFVNPNTNLSTSPDQSPPIPFGVCEDWYLCLKSRALVLDPLQCQGFCSQDVKECVGGPGCADLPLQTCLKCQFGSDLCPPSGRQCFLQNSSIPTVSQCEAQGICLDTLWIYNLFCSDSGSLDCPDVDPPFNVFDFGDYGGVCVLPWINFLDLSFPNETVSPIGRLLYADEKTCQDSGGEFRWFSLTEESCLSGSNCQIPPLVSLQNLTECGDCGGDLTSPFYWKSNTFENKAVQLQTTTRAPTRVSSVASLFDVNRLTETVLAASLEDMDNSYASRTLCEHSAYLYLVSEFVCDCVGVEKHPNCFESLAILPNAVGFPCPFSESKFVSPPFSFTFSNTSIDSSSSICPGLKLQFRSASLLLAPQSRSTPSLFNRQYDLKNYRVSSRKNQEVGQVQGDGFVVSSGIAQIASDVLICIALRDDLESLRDPNYLTPDFGFLEQSSGRILPYLFETAYLNHTTLGFEICAVVPILLNASSYFPIFRIADIKDSDDILYDTTDLGIIYTTSALYFLALSFCFVRIIQLAWYQAINSLRIFNPLCLSIFNIFRAIYFLLIGLGELADAPSYVTFLLVDIPYFFWFLGLTLLLWWWVALAFTPEKENIQRNFFTLVLTSSTLIASVLMIVGILYVSVETSVLPQCGGRVQPDESDELSTQNIILITYKSILAVICLGCGVLFGITAQKLRKIASDKIENRILITTWLSFASFFSQSVYFVFLAAFSSDDNAFTNSVYSLIPLWFIEIFPQIFMLLLQQPENKKAQKSPSRRLSRSLSLTLSSSMGSDVPLTPMGQQEAPRIITSDLSAP